MKAIFYIGLVVDCIAVLLAFACLFHRNARIQGLCKLGWELVAGLSCFFLLSGFHAEMNHAFDSGYAKGESGGYAKGYRIGESSGFNNGFDSGESNEYVRGYGSGESSG